MRLATVLAINLTLMIIATGASATTWTIEADGTGDAPTIQAGIDSAVVGDTVEAMSGFYYEHDILLKSGVVLRSKTGQSDCVTIAAQYDGRVIYCDSVDATATIEGFTMIRGWISVDAVWPENCGAAIFLQNSSPTIRNCVIKWNVAGKHGGGIFCIENSSPSLTNVVFLENQSGGDGGGLVCYTNSSPVVTDCVFEENDADSRGGGVAVLEDSHPSLSECVFQSNQGHEGGGLYINVASTADVDDCDFFQNRGRYVGGAVEVKNGGFASMNGCLFQSNTAMDDGGAVRAEFGEASVALTECDFVENISNDRGGGAIFTWGGSHTIENCTFTGNKVSWNFFGGAIELRDNVAATVSGCEFTNNHCAGDGGAIYARNFSPEIRDCLFDGNYGPDGGAIYLQSCPAPIIEGCVFTGNTGNRGGGIQFWTTNSLHTGSVENCTFYGNYPNQHGSGIYITGASPTITNTIIAFGLLSDAVYCADTLAAPVMTCCDIYGNAGGDWVGCIADQEGINGNFSADPLFCDADSDDFTLDAASPCLSEPGCGQIGAFGQGCDIMTSIAGGDPVLPQIHFLSPNRPNPFNPVTKLTFGIPEPSEILLDVYDVSGRLVAVLSRGDHDAGIFEETWNGRDRMGRPVPSGVYFARLHAGDFSVTRKMVLIR